ncbi:MAG: HD-GYP domain-containing protein [bacterium]
MKKTKATTTHLPPSTPPTYFNIMATMVNALEQKDVYTKKHSERVMKLSALVARKLDMPPQEILLLQYASILHDIGKIGIEPGILQKKGPLNADEYKNIKAHSLIGEKIIQPLDFLGEISTFVRQHHERLDGTGYPLGQQKNSLPLESRILSVVDAYDAMNSNRPYRPALNRNVIMKELENNAGSQFDPIVIEALLHIDYKGKIINN